MRKSTKLGISLAILLFGFLLVPRAALADTYSNCPTEPASNVAIAPGETFSGSSCNLSTDGDIDSFVFNGTTGEIYQFAAAISGAAPTNMCLTLYNPGLAQIFSGCTNVAFGVVSVVIDRRLTATGTYTIDITEAASAKLNYGVSLERLYPFPSDAQAIPKINTSLAGNITPLTDSDARTFPSATTGKYRVTATMTSTNSNLCMTVYFPNFTSNGPGCTNIAFGVDVIHIDFTPTSAQAGTNMVFLQVYGNASTATYTLEVSCLVGVCPAWPMKLPPCTLADALSYNATTSTLTMKFTVGNNLGTSANWSAWLTYADVQGTNVDTMQPLFSQLQPITNPPKTITKTVAGLPKEGKVGVLSTLSTPHLSTTAKTEGIACSSWEQINTGTEP